MVLDFQRSGRLVRLGFSLVCFSGGSVARAFRVCSFGFRIEGVGFGGLSLRV